MPTFVISNPKPKHNGGVLARKRERHPDPDPVWFHTEADFNKYSFEPSFEDYLQKYALHDFSLNKSQPLDIKKGVQETKDSKASLCTQEKPAKCTTEAKAKTQSAPQNDDCKVQQQIAPQIKDDAKETKQLNNNKSQANVSVFPKLTLPYPYASSITRDEQLFYIKSYIKQRPDNPAMLQVAKEIDQRIKIEQIKFQEFLQKYTLANPTKYLFLQPGFRFKIKACLANKLITLNAKFSHNYELQKTISLASGVAFNSDPIMKHIKTVSNQIKICALKIPDHKTIIDLNKLISADPFCDHFHGDSKTNKGISQTSAENNIDIVISSLSLITLVDNQAPEFSRTWKIPIEIKHLGEGNNTIGKKRVAIMSDPLPPNAMSTRDANYFCYREVLKGMMQDSTRKLDFTLRGQGIVNDTQEPALKKSEEKKHGRDESSHDQKGQLSTENAEKPDHCNQSCEGEKLSSDREPNAAPGEKADIDNVRFDIWKLGKIKILVSSKCDGYAVGSSNDGQARRDVIYRIFPKTEYQSSFGVEEFSVSELTRAWWETHLCRDSHLLCIRIDPRSSEILHTADYQCSNLVGPNCPFQPKFSMKLLHSLLKEIENQSEEGCYMLTHNKGDMHACLYKQIASKQDEKSSTSKQDEKSSTSKQDEKSSTSKQDEKSSTSKHDDKSSTSKQDEKSSTSKEDEKSSTSKQDEKSSTSKQDEKSSTSKQDEKSSTSKQDDTTGSGYRPLRDYCSVDDDSFVNDNSVNWLRVDTNIILPAYMDTNRVPCLFPLQDELLSPKELDAKTDNNKQNKKRKKGKGKAKKNAVMQKRLNKGTNAMSEAKEGSTRDTAMIHYGDLDLDF
eukprot:gene3216-3693_t